MAHQPREAVLTERALYLAAEAAGTEGEAADLHSRPAQRHQVGRTPALGAEGKGSERGKRARGESGLEQFASSECGHCVLPGSICLDRIRTSELN